MRGMNPRELAEAWVEAFNTGDEVKVWRIFNINVVNHTAAIPSLTGIESMVGELMTYRTAFPDLQVAIHDTVVSDDMVLCRWSARGHHTGPLMGIPPRGTPVETTGMFLIRTRDGGIAEHWVYLDLPGMLQQMDVLPMLSQPPAFSPQDAPPQREVSESVRRRNMQLAKALFTVALEGDIASIKDLLSPGAIDHTPLIPGQPAGIPGVQQTFAHLNGALSNRRLKVDHLFSEGNRVAIGTTLTGIHSGNLLGIEATGKPLTLTGLNIICFDDNSLMTDRWGESNSLDLLMQLGVAPPLDADDGVAV